MTFKREISAENLPALLAFLKDNAYWQKNLTLARLKLLINNSQCFYALSDSDEIIGFSRVVTNNTSFSSLWDVVIDDKFRGNGIATALMAEIFSDALFCKITNWVLFTDTAKSLYAKFGFVSEVEMPSRKLAHKLRLQESCPSYMEELIRVTAYVLFIDLNKQQSFQFLFGYPGKRSVLPFF